MENIWKIATLQKWLKSTAGIFEYSKFGATLIFQLFFNRFEKCRFFKHFYELCTRRIRVKKYQPHENHIITKCFIFTLNTLQVVVQYDKDLLEVWDEAKRLRCEWFNDYEKTASKPPMVIADLDVIQLDFRGFYPNFKWTPNGANTSNRCDNILGDNVDCWMEIQHGKGPWAPPVSGIVPLGSTLTLVVAINDYRGRKNIKFIQKILCPAYRALPSLQITLSECIVKSKFIESKF